MVSGPSKSPKPGLPVCRCLLHLHLEWSPGKLVWKINDKVFKTQTAGVPDEEMYINFSANLKEGRSLGLPSAMEVDWIRVYKPVLKWLPSGRVQCPAASCVFAGFRGP
ncbi:MAG: hypothetical protein R2751_11110 [Bacteroidales bacterium]